MVGVVLVDVGAEVDLAERLLDRLAHLAHDDLGERLAALAVQLADLPTSAARSATEVAATSRGGRGRRRRSPR